MREHRFSSVMKMKSNLSLMSIDREKNFSRREELRMRKATLNNWKI
jgi:hypothetical protein